LVKLTPDLDKHTYSHQIPHNHSTIVHQRTCQLCTLIVEACWQYRRNVYELQLMCCNSCWVVDQSYFGPPLSEQELIVTIRVERCIQLNWLKQKSRFEYHTRDWISDIDFIVFKSDNLLAAFNNLTSALIQAHCVQRPT